MVTDAAHEPDRPWLAVLNPVAGGGHAGRAWPSLLAALTAAGVACELAATRSSGHAGELVAAAHARGARRFLAVGGDGTLHEVVNGLPADPGRVALAVAPFGTGNDWARGLGVPRAPAALAKMMRAGRRRAHDLGTIEYWTRGERQRRRFLNVAGVGYDADVLDRLPRRGPQRLRYLWAVLAGLARYRPPYCRIVCGAERIEAALLVAFAAIGRSCGGGLVVAPAAEPDDGLLDLLAVRAISPLSACLRLPKLYAGRFGGDPAAITARGPSVAIDAEPPAGVEADGQRLGSTPVHIELSDRAIDAIVP